MACFPHPTLVQGEPGNLLEFLDETYTAKARWMGLLPRLLYGENCMILTSTTFY